MVTNNCLNCNHLVSDDAHFCSHCGQSTRIHHITFGYFIHEATHFFTHADRGIFSLIKNLALKPGQVGREYLEGKRKKYMAPLNFFLIMVGLFVLALTTFQTFQRTNDFAEWRASISKIPDKEIRERRLEKINRAEKASNFMTRKSNLVSLLVATPLLSLVFYLFYRRRGFNYFEHLAINFYFAGFASLFFIIIIAPLLKLVNNNSFYLVAIGCFLIFEMIYRSIAYYQFFQRKGNLEYLKALLASVIGIILWVILSRSAITFYINNGFLGI